MPFAMAPILISLSHSLLVHEDGDFGVAEEQTAGADAAEPWLKLFGVEQVVYVLGWTAGGLVWWWVNAEFAVWSSWCTETLRRTGTQVTVGSHD
eukprot:6461528-Amphidinium_carterae.2